MALVKFDRGLYRNGNTAKGLNYGQIEENQTWFNRAGMVEAQCALDPECFSDVQVAPLTKYVAAQEADNTDPENPVAASDAVKIVAQNGAFLQIDKSMYLATIPTQDGKAAGMPVGINYSSEKLYDDFKKARRNFFLTTQDWLPRIGYVEKGMRITTNTVQWDNSKQIQSQSVADVTLDLNSYTDTSFSYDFFGDVQAWIKNQRDPLYAAVIDGSDGELVIGADILTEGVPDPDKYIILAQVVAAYDNADRTCSFMFQILDGGTK